MDLRTGKMYATIEEARADGVPESDIAHVVVDPSIRELIDSIPVVEFSKGPFKDRQYKRMPNGQLVRV